MPYSVKYAQLAVKQLKKLDKCTRTLILAWVKKNLVDTDDPHMHGRGLTANHKGKWRYRVGDYRLLAEIQENKLVILVLTVGHRKSVY
ncbi:MAG: type II toxin-antitoxin system RelE/ParE family toxin [Deferribacteraceae bacterium]|jgi:mRNA interferase RelE/StbE|nr:type II toxin-antitoxin system RelE/ParE family toxin [Deferribacteraceae bacterium]